MKYIISIACAVIALGGDAKAYAATDHQTTSIVYTVSSDGIEDPIGSLSFRDSPRGLVITPNLTGLPPGKHGFHVHEKPDCSPGDKDGNQVAALAAGGHFDPDHTGKHLGPHGPGHRGDMPVLLADNAGRVQRAVTAPRLHLADIQGRALIIHAGGDNESDQPQPLGGGGSRIACAVVE